MAWDQYAANEMARAAVERQFEIAGEALSQLSKLDPSTANRIADHRQIIAFRNVLIHGYALIEDRRVWDAVSQRVQPLMQTLEAVLAEGSDLEDQPRNEP